MFTTLVDTSRDLYLVNCGWNINTPEMGPSDDTVIVHSVIDKKISNGKVSMVDYRIVIID